MAIRRDITDWRDRIVAEEIMRDDGTNRREFKYPEELEEASSYYNYLQSLDNQETSIRNQGEIAKQLKRNNDILENSFKQNYGRRTSSITNPQESSEYSEFLAWKNNKNIRPRRVYGSRRVLEEREKERLLDLANKINQGVIQVDSDTYSIPIIVTEDLFVFTNNEVILRIARMKGSDDFYYHLLLKYGDLPGIYQEVLNNSFFLSIASARTLLQLIKCSNNNEDVICEVFAKGNEFSLWKDKLIYSLDSASLKALLSKNLVPIDTIDAVESLVFELDNKERIFNGIIKDERDLSYAEDHYTESENYKFLLVLAKQSSDTDVLGEISQIIDDYFDSCSHNLTKTQCLSLCKALLKNPNFEDKFLVLDYLIDNLKKESSLQEIKAYCKDVQFQRWLNRMTQLGFLDERGAKAEYNKKYNIDTTRDSFERVSNLLQGLIVVLLVWGGIPLIIFLLLKLIFR